MCARFTVLSDTPIPSAIAGCVIPISRHSTIWMRSRCAGGNFQCRAVFSRRTSALLHLIICPPNQMVGSESCRARKKYCTNHTHRLSPQKSRFKRVWRRYKRFAGRLARYPNIDILKTSSAEEENILGNVALSLGNVALSPPAEEEDILATIKPSWSKRLSLRGKLGAS